MLFTGYVDTNGNTVIKTTSSDYRGFNLVEINVVSCSASKIRRFDTLRSTNDSDNMATYISKLPSNTVLIGITADDAQASLTQNAKSALLAIGVNVNGLQWRGKAIFVAQIGRPAVSVSLMASSGGNNLQTSMAVTSMSSLETIFVIMC